MIPLVYLLIWAVFVLFLAIGLGLFLVLVLDSLIRDHDLPTSQRAISVLVETIKEYRPEAKAFYDLGCGRGSLALKLKKLIPQLDVYGLDKNRIRVLWAQLLAKAWKQPVNFKRENIFQADLRQADIVYAYLWYDLMPLLEKKLEKELKKGALVITNTSHLPNWRPIKKIPTYPRPSRLPDFETLFVYLKKTSMDKERIFNNNE